MSSFDKIDFFTDESLATDPYPYFEHLRSRCPVYREPHHGVVAVTGYDEAVAVYGDHEVFSSSNSPTGPFSGLPFEPEGDDIGALIEQYSDQLPLTEDRMADIKIAETEHGPPGARRYDYEPTYILRGFRRLHLEYVPIT